MSKRHYELDTSSQLFTNPSSPKNLSDDELQNKKQRDSVFSNRCFVLIDAAEKLFPPLNDGVVKETNCCFNDAESCYSLSERSSKSLNLDEDVLDNSSPSAANFASDRISTQDLLLRSELSGSSPSALALVNFEDDPQKLVISSSSYECNCDLAGPSCFSDNLASVMNNRADGCSTVLGCEPSSSPAMGASSAQESACDSVEKENPSCDANELSAENDAKRLCLDKLEESLVLSCLKRVPVVRLSDASVLNYICRDVTVVVDRLPPELARIRRPKKSPHPCICYDSDLICCGSDSDSEYVVQPFYSPPSPLYDTDFPINNETSQSPSNFDIKDRYLFDSIDLNAQETVNDSFVIFDFDSRWKHVETTKVEVSLTVG